MVKLSRSPFTLHVKTVGNPESNKAIILLHGFPEFWYAWKKVADYLVDQDYYCILPDQRGYNLSDSPYRVGNYTLCHLAGDIVDLVTWTGRDRIILGGHDWGGAVTWAVASLYPEILDRVIIVNAPHTKVMTKTLRSNRRQRRKSWYMLFFQFPILPQFVMRFSNFNLLKTTISRTSRRGTFTDEEIQLYRNAWRGNVRTMLNWYRAAFQRKSGITYSTIKIPVRILWGKRDAFLTADMACESLDYCDEGKLIYIDDATHWVLHEEPQIVAQHVTEFVEGGTNSNTSGDDQET